MTGFETLDVMDLEKPDKDRKGCAPDSCSICLDLLLDRGERSVAKLYCGHEFHLDCIGSAFNAKGAMQCPNCRKVEKGQWLYAHGHRPSTDFDFDGWIAEDIYGLNYSELPLGYQWCPFSGFTQLSSLFEDIESQPNSYHEPLSNSAFGDRSTISGRNHICHYLALDAFLRPIHSAPSSSTDHHHPDNSQFHRHGQPSAEVLNTLSYPSAEPPNRSWQQPPSLSIPLPTNLDHQFGQRLSRNDLSNHQPRLGSFIHPRPLSHGSVTTRSGSGSNLVTGSMPPPVTSQSSPFLPIRRSRPRVATLISTATSTVSNPSNRNLQDTGRQFDRAYRWGRDNFAPLPWIPVDGESRWWNPFNPNHASQPGTIHQRGGTTNERVAQIRTENGSYLQLLQPPPPPPYM